VWLVTKPFAPLPQDLFQFSLDKPMNRRDGWLLWALIGIAAGFAGVGVTSYLLSLLQDAGADGAQAVGTADAVVSILSKDPKVFLSLLTVTSVMAPLLEEVIFRGFLLTTLTKWLPAPTAAFVSAGLFGAAHLTSKDFAQLTALGVVLGLTYIRTKNLVTPILIHSFWNSGVLCVLEILYLGGYDVKELIK
jgi:membrane protease YdiL (CAAX protease family)